MQGLLGVQDMTEPLKVNILMGALTGMAKRQVSVVAPGQRDTVAKIVTIFDGRYTGKVPIPVLRSQFYSCTQKPDELVENYTLRLQELHCRLLQLDPDGAPTDIQLREQFLLGLEDGPLLQTLKIHVRQKPDSSFDEIQMEAALLEENRYGRKRSEVIQTFGCPARFHSDRGPNFESDMMKQLCDFYGIVKSRTTPYHASGNGRVEKMNQTLLNMLRTLEAERKTRWPEYLPKLLQAYNSTAHSATGFAPSYLMFGQHIRLPVDVSLGVTPVYPKQNIAGWVRDHHQTFYWQCHLTLPVKR